MSTLKLDPRIQELIGILSTAIGSPVVCAGGAARDALHMREPKDYDLFLLGGSYVWSRRAQQAAIDAGVSLTLYERDWVLEPYDGEEDTRIDWVLQGEYKGLVIDLIRYSDMKTDVIQQVEAFDCTLSMAWFDEDGNAVAHSRFPSEDDMTIYNLERQLKQDRVDHLQAKYPQYDYSGIKIRGAI